MVMTRVAAEPMPWMKRRISRLAKEGTSTTASDEAM